MAFNPFHSFRKHQKVIFAGLTILCMVTFVLAGSFSGGGDFFGEIQRIVSGRSRAVVKVYGREVSPPEMALLRQQRVLANEFMTQAVGRAEMGLLRDLFQNKKYADLLLQMQDILIPEQFRQGMNPMQLTFFFNPQFAVGHRQQLEFLKRRLEDAKKTADAELVGQYLQSLDQANRPRGKGEFYFGGTTKESDLFDFLIWRHQADRLGIRLTNDEVKQEVVRETYRRFTSEDSKLVVAMLRQRYANLTTDVLFQALGDEFRVRLAKIALGYEPDHRSGPATPYEYWNDFREKRVENVVAVLPISVREPSGSLDKDWVKDVDKLGPPGEKELEDLFNRYKNQELDPRGREPGFKQPRRVRIEWVEAKTDARYFKQEAARTTALIEALVSGAYNARMLLEYNAYREQIPTWTSPMWPGFFRLHDSSLWSPQSVAGAVGLAAVGGDGTILAAPSPVHATMMTAELRGRLRVGSSWILSATGPVLSGLTLSASWVPSELPESALRGQAMERIQDEVAHDLVTGTLNQLKTDVQKQKKLPADALKKYGLEEGTTKEPLNRFALADAKGLEPFRDAFRKENFFDRQNESQNNEQFARLFLDLKGPFEPATWPTPRFPGDKTAGGSFLYWITEDKPAYVPESMTAVRTEVVNAWRLLKARQLAREEGDRLAAKTHAAGADAVRDLKHGTDHSKKDGLFVLGGPDNTMPAVSRLTKVPVALPGHPPQYRPYDLPAGKIAATNPATSQAIVDKLLALREKGDTAVFWDQDENTYYVAALLDRIQPTVNEFYQYYRGLAGQTRPSPEEQQFEQKRRTEFRQALMDRLRADAGLWVNPEFQKADQSSTED